jgi:biopolymer transport protein ExbD
MNSVVAQDDDGDEAPRKSRRSRRLARHLKRGGGEELNIVSMIDVFAVLVFFLLVSSSITAARLNVLSLNLPSNDSVTPPEKQPLKLTVSLLPDKLTVSDRNGAVRELYNTPAGYNLQALSQVLVETKKAAPTENSLTLLISADVTYDNVVKVMDAARLTPADARDLGLPKELYPLIAIGDAIVTTPGAAP